MTAKTVLHSHNSIPCFTGYEDEGCVVCMRNKVIEEIRAAMPSVEDIAFLVSSGINKYSNTEGWNYKIATAIRELIEQRLK